MKPEEIKALIKIVEESGIDEIEVSRWWKKVRIRKNGAINPVQLVTAKQQSIEQDVVITDTGAGTAAPVKKDEKPAVAEGHEIKSPMVGTFYRAPAPGEKPFAEIGDSVKKGQVLCIIEAMKLMNEIESDVDGEIIDIIIDNAQPVEFNQTLFIIKQ